MSWTVGNGYLKLVLGHAQVCNYVRRKIYLGVALDPAAAARAVESDLSLIGLRPLWDRPLSTAQSTTSSESSYVSFVD